MVFSATSNLAGLDVVTPQIGAPNPTVIHLALDRRDLINPDSVGQPRDGNPRATYGIYDSADSRGELRRVPYRVNLAQRRRFSAAGSPDALTRRLGMGR